jgi:hypothetical protein
MDHPEIKRKLNVVTYKEAAQVSFDNNQITTVMTVLELAYAAQLLLEAADVLRRNERARFNPLERVAYE